MKRICDHATKNTEETRQKTNAGRRVFKGTGEEKGAKDWREKETAQQRKGKENKSKKKGKGRDNGLGVKREPVQALSEGQSSPILHRMGASGEKKSFQKGTHAHLARDVVGKVAEKLQEGHAHTPGS